MRTIDDLITDLNEIAKKPSAESLRIFTMTSVRQVMYDIGLRLTANIELEEIQIKVNRYSIPDRVIKVIDIGKNRHDFQGLDLESGLANYNHVTYTITPREIIFPQLRDEKLWMKYYSFYTDDFGAPLIPDEAYMACFDYCHAQLAFKNPVSPVWQDRWNLQGLAKQSVFNARGQLNEMTPGRLRGFRNMM